MFNPQGGFDPMTFNVMLNMMNILYPNMGYNINNYNMNNQQILMNMMMNWMNTNPIILQMYNNVLSNYNNLNQNINNNNNNINMNNNAKRMNFVNVSKSDLEQIKVNGGVLNTNAANFNLDTTNPFDNSPKLNIIFMTQKHQRATIIATYNMKIKDLLMKYISKIGLGPNVMGNSIFFLFNGKQIDINEEQTIRDYGLKAGAIILVLDVKEVIGA